MTIYANIVNVRPAGRNVVLEFSSYFGERGQRFPPEGQQPEVRVVLSSDLVASLRIADQDPPATDRAAVARSAAVEPRQLTVGSVADVPS